MIQEHLELKRRNAALEHEMPIEKYMNDDPFENHPLFKTEEQARVEDTMDGVQSIEDEVDVPRLARLGGHVHRRAGPGARRSGRRRGRRGAQSEEASDESLWSRSRDFDWGD